jgi:2-polyprenyl-3-methyl-5-hydroxy-6-metoxy-1,4-benzoquinol methylase
VQFITDDYRKLNAELHKNNIHYGIGGHKHAENVFNLSKDLNTQDVLDYGCGKGYLADNLPFKIQKYDPAIPVYAELPTPADIVVCTDVLEHVEPECLKAVLEHLHSLVKQVGLLTIAFQASKKNLPDGRNTHLIQRNKIWWMLKLSKKFDITFFQAFEKYGVFLVKPFYEKCQKEKK